MAYMGTTEASSVQNPPILLAGGMGAGPDVRITDGSTKLFTGNNAGQSSTATPRPGLGSGQSLWMYMSTMMDSNGLNAGGIVDAARLGMRPGDVIIMVGHGTTVQTSWYLGLNVINYITTAGVAYMSTQSVITSS